MASVVAAVSERLDQPVSLQSKLDVDVYRLRGTRGGPDFVARAFGPQVEGATLDAVATVLHNLASTRFPAERCPTDRPVAPIGDAGHVLVTEYVEPSPAPSPGFILAWCAGLLGGLATRSGDDLPAGGGWHRLGSTPWREIDQALRLGGQVDSSLAEVQDTLAGADDGTGLPEALVHPDLTPANAIAQGDQPPVVIDWIGVGHAPRVWPLAFLLFTAGPRLARRTLDRYTRSVTLSDEEQHRLPGVMIARPLCLDLWSVANDRMSPQRAVARCRAHQARTQAITAALTHPDNPNSAARTLQ